MVDCSPAPKRKPSTELADATPHGSTEGHARHLPTSSMVSHMQWPDLLEEETYLVQLVSDTPPDIGALEQTTSCLEVLRADLQSCTSEIADIEQDIRDNPSKSDTPSKSTSSTSRFLHRVTESISSIHSHEEKRLVREGRLLEAKTRMQTLRMEIKNLELKARILRHRTRHHEELKQRLKELYNHIFDGASPASVEEQEAERDVQKAQQALHQTQRIMDRHKTLVALLVYGEFALSSAGNHFTTAISSGAKGANSTAFQAELTVAKAFATQGCIVVDQVKWLDPLLFEQENASDVFAPEWMSNVFPAQSTKNGDAQQHSQQALQSRHAVLVSLLNLTRHKSQEYEKNLRRAANRYADAYVRKQSLRRRVVTMYAGVEDDRPLGEAEVDRGGLARMRDVTAGLDKALTEVVPPRVVSPQGGEETKGRSTESQKRWSSQDLSRSDVAALQDQPRSLTPNSMKRSLTSGADLRVPQFPRLSPEEVAMRRGQSPSRDPSRSRLTAERSRSPPPSPGMRDMRPSLDSRPGDVRANPGPSRPLPVEDAPASGSGELRPQEIRTSPQPPYGVSPQGLTPRTPTGAQFASRPPGAQAAPPSSFRSGDIVQPVHPERSFSQSNSIIVTPQSPKRVVGILKTSTVTQPPPTDLSDPWGVKIASAEPSRPVPKLKKMVAKWRGTEATKSSIDLDSGTRSRSYSTTTDPSPTSSSTQDSPRSKQWKLRFSEAVDVIPRPPIDSDPYEDEDEDYLPPSPKRGSLIWRTDGQVEDDEIKENSVGSSPTEYPFQPRTQIDPDPRMRGVPSDSQALYSRGVHPVGYDSGPTFPGTSSPERYGHTMLSPSSLLDHNSAAATQGLHQGLSEYPGGESGAIQQGRQRNEPSRAYAPQPLLGVRTAPFDDLEVERHRTLATSEDARGRMMSPSDSNLPSFSRAASQLPPGPAPLVARGLKMRSDHDLVQTIFPSPRSTAAERDLSFAK